MGALLAGLSAESASGGGLQPDLNASLGSPPPPDLEHHSLAAVLPEPQPEVEGNDEERSGDLAGLLSSLHGFLNADPEATLATASTHK